MTFVGAAPESLSANLGHVFGIFGLLLAMSSYGRASEGANLVLLSHIVTAVFKSIFDLFLVPPPHGASRGGSGLLFSKGHRWFWTGCGHDPGGNIFFIFVLGLKCSCVAFPGFAGGGGGLSHKGPPGRLARRTSHINEDLKKRKLRAPRGPRY